MSDQGASPDMIWVSSLVSNRTREGMVNLQWGGHGTQLTVQQARQLGIHFLEAAEAAESDAGMFHVLTQLVGIDEARAYRVLQDVRNYREQREKKI